MILMYRVKQALDQSFVVKAVRDEAEAEAVLKEANASLGPFQTLEAFLLEGHALITG